MQARYYDPVIGRFYSNDPVAFDNVHNFNRFAYANNNPYKYVDPDGKNSTTIGIITILVGGGLIAAVDSSRKGAILEREGKAELIDAAARGDSQGVEAARAKIRKGNSMKRLGTKFGAIAISSARGLPSDTSKATVSVVGKLYMAIIKSIYGDENNKNDTDTDSEVSEQDENQQNNNKDDTEDDKNK